MSVHVLNIQTFPGQRPNLVQTFGTGSFSFGENPYASNVCTKYLELVPNITPLVISSLGDNAGVGKHNLFSLGSTARATSTDHAFDD